MSQQQWIDEVLASMNGFVFGNYTELAKQAIEAMNERLVYLPPEASYQTVIRSASLNGFIKEIGDHTFQIIVNDTQNVLPH